MSAAQQQEPAALSGAVLPVIDQGPKNFAVLYPSGMDPLSADPKKLDFASLYPSIMVSAGKTPAEIARMVAARRGGDDDLPPLVDEDSDDESKKPSGARPLVAEPTPFFSVGVPHEKITMRAIDPLSLVYAQLVAHAERDGDARAASRIRDETKAHGLRIDEAIVKAISKASEDPCPVSEEFARALLRSSPGAAEASDRARPTERSPDAVLPEPPAQFRGSRHDALRAEYDSLKAKLVANEIGPAQFSALWAAFKDVANSR